jgi:hypothetical protein
MTYFPSYDTGHIENYASNNYSILASVFVTAVMFLPSRCVAKIGEFLPSRCLAAIRGLLQSRYLATIGDTQTHARAHTHRHQRDHISLLLFFQNKESRLKSDYYRPNII